MDKVIENILNSQTRYIFKLKTHVMEDKYAAMKAISKIDPTAEFRITGDWSLRVRTELTYNDMMQIMMYSQSFNRLKKAWFFNIDFYKNL